jgi:hypothetical protein
MVNFSFKSLKSIPKFFAYRNDIDIYTEDKSADKEFYRTLFQRLLGEKIKINDITPLGCKANVIDAYENQQVNSQRKKYFIVDGDLDLIIGTNRKNEKNLIVLDAYCIENYLIDELGAIELIYYSKGTEERDKISKALNFEKWLEYNHKELIELFIHFAILRMFDGGPKLRNAGEFLKQEKKQTMLDCTQIINYTVQIKQEIISKLEELGFENPQLEYEKSFNNLSEKWETSNKTLLTIVSGKDYLIPLLQHRINFCINKGKSMFPKQSLKLFLASNSDLTRLDFLKERIK